MSDVGFLYVLANSAMPRMVKIGKTTRSPEERAKELSAATGLPTPFIVIYEQLFLDCTEAENFVHTFLTGRGFRISSNREFFSAPTSEVVRAISLAPGAINQDEADIQRNEFSQGLDREGLDESTLPSTPPWHDIYNEARNYSCGNGNHVQDCAEAINLYKQAAKLGCLAAYRDLGDMHKHGQGVNENFQNALEFYREGAEKGSLICYWEMGNLFNERSAGCESAIKCYLNFINEYRNRSPRLDGYVDRPELNYVCRSLARIFIESNLRSHYKIPDDLMRFSLQFSSEIIDESKKMIEYSRATGDREQANYFKKVIEYYSAK